MCLSKYLCTVLCFFLIRKTNAEYILSGILLQDSRSSLNQFVTFFYNANCITKLISFLEIMSSEKNRCFKIISNFFMVSHRTFREAISIPTVGSSKKSISVIYFLGLPFKNIPFFGVVFLAILLYQKECLFALCVYSEGFRFNFYVRKLSYIYNKNKFAQYE